MTCKEHSIEVKNIDEKAQFSRQILLIVGTVKSPCNQQYVEYKINDSDFVKKSLFNGCFKILIRLKRDTPNSLKIKYCEIQNDVMLQHTTVTPVLYDIQPLYIIPRNHDGRFQSEESTDNSLECGLEKTDLIMQLAQCVISTKINEIGHEEKTFVLQKCQVFHSNLDIDEARNMNQWDLYDKIALELIKNFGADVGNRRKFVGFMSCTKFLGLAPNESNSYINIKNKTQANPSLGNGFLALLGNGSYYSLPTKNSEVLKAFNNKTVVDTTKLLDDSNYRKSYGGCFSTFLGSLIHEIGHIFDLGHSNSGLMGTDIDYTHRFFSCQNFTEIMPARNISNCQQNQKIENISSNRFTKIKKNGAYMEKYHEQKNNDMTFYEQNCSLILLNHKWFTQNDNIDSVNIKDNIVYSDNSDLVLVEIRESDSKNFLMKKFWDLRNQNLRKFEIPEDFKLENVTVFAINANGSSSKQKFSVT